MSIWVDADACPNAIKEILFKAANRTETATILVANHFLATPPSAWITMQQVASGFDIADDYIVQHVTAGDLVITSDIPLAAEVIEKKALVINARGEKLSASNIKQRLNMRDFMDTMRASGEHTGGTAALGQREKQAFANALDQYLTRAKK